MTSFKINSELKNKSRAPNCNANVYALYKGKYYFCNER